MLSLKFLLGLVLGLVALVHAVPISEDGLQPSNFTLPGLDPSSGDVASTLGYDPSFSYHDYSIVQAWMGLKKVQAGDLAEADLFKAVASAFEDSCPASKESHGHCGTLYPQPQGEIRSHCQKQSGVLQIYAISAEWQTEEIRNLLIHAVAGFLGAVTVQDPRDSSNCFWMAGKRACNIGDVVRVNMPTWNIGGAGRWRNFMHIRLHNYWTGYGDYDCCVGDGLKQMDGVWDELEGTARHAFRREQKDWYRDSRCIINGWKTC